ncbi:hypothetical protein C0991_009940, partial [Blastosporella zonata]
PRAEGMMYTDFTFSKPVPSRLPAPRMDITFGLLEIKTSDEDESDIESDRADIQNALNQIYAYAARVSKARFTVCEPDTSLVPSFIVYGNLYTKVIERNLNGVHLYSVSTAGLMRSQPGESDSLSSRSPSVPSTRLFSF